MLITRISFHKIFPLSGIKNSEIYFSINSQRTEQFNCYIIIIELQWSYYDDQNRAVNWRFQVFISQVSFNTKTQILSLPRRTSTFQNKTIKILILLIHSAKKQEKHANEI